MRLLYRPFGLLFSVVGGLAASAIFKRVWRGVAHEDEAPSATDASRGEIVTAAALEGAVFSAMKAIADRGEQPGFARATGTWPGRTRPANHAGQRRPVPVDFPNHNVAGSPQPNCRAAPPGALSVT
jgi:hypothetical protein